MPVRGRPMSYRLDLDGVRRIVYPVDHAVGFRNRANPSGGAPRVMDLLSGSSRSSPGVQCPPCA
jgi:hypothetical protein